MQLIRLMRFVLGCSIRDHEKYHVSGPVPTLRHKKVLYKMVLVSDILDHIGRIASPLNLKIQKLKFVRNTAPDNQRVLNFMRNSDWRIFLLEIALFVGL